MPTHTQANGQWVRVSSSRRLGSVGAGASRVVVKGWGVPQGSVGTGGAARISRDGGAAWISRDGGCCKDQ